MNPNDSLKFSKIMTSNLINVSPEETFEAVDKIFKKNGFHHLSVVKEGQGMTDVLSESGSSGFLSE